MSLSRALFICALIGFLQSCQITPTFGPQGGAVRFYNAVELDAPSSRFEYLFYQSMDERLKDRENGEFQLAYSVSNSTRRGGIDSTGRAHRVLVSGSAGYTLRKVGEKQAISTGSVSGFVGYSSLATSVAAEASRRDADQRLARILADKVVEELAIFARREEF